MTDSHTLFVLLVIFMAYVFDFTNGFHDAANSIATIVYTGVLTPRQAVLWAAFFNFIAFMVFNVMVATTIGKGLIVPDVVDARVIFAALTGAISWNIATWYYGLPSSSSYALIGGLAGAAVARGGFVTLVPEGFLKVAAGMFISPIVGLLAGFILVYAFTRMFQNKPERQVLGVFKSLQLISSAMLSLTHGGNDAQKTMGLIAVVLFSASWLNGAFYIPLWVVVSCYGTIALGTLFGGWRVVRTMGTQITPLNPLRGCAAEASAAAMIFVATENGVPVSTTQTVTGSIAGVGLLQGWKGTCWPVLRVIFAAWLITIPAAGFVSGMIIYFLP